MFYVYRLESLSSPGVSHIGVTSQLNRKVEMHNRLEISQTARNAPWRLAFYAAFTRKSRAQAFASWLKSPEGRAFGRRHLWNPLRDPETPPPSPETPET